jgi:hypothetical protein
VQLNLEALEERNLLSAFTPFQIRHAYGFDNIWFKDANGQATIRGDGTGQTIAIIGSLDDPWIENDVAVFDKAYGVPDFNQPNGPQFAVYWPNDDQGGQTPPPTADIGRIEEMSMDVEWAHAMAPGANIALVEARSTSAQDYFNAVAFAKGIQVPGGGNPSVISMSFGWDLTDPQNQGIEQSFDSYLEGGTASGNLVFVAASGDDGVPNYPASAPTVIAVGGTSLRLDDQGNYAGEDIWASSGAGPDQNEKEPAYQYTVQSSGYRYTADVAYDADPATGFSVYDTPDFNPFLNEYGWIQEGGTSAGAPQWAALMAIADQGLTLNNEPFLGSESSNPTALTELYHLPAADFHKVSGANYQPNTGLGSPYADRIVRDLVYDDQPQVTPVLAYPVEGENASLTLARFSVSDPDVDQNSYTATIDWGDGTPLDTNPQINSDGQGGFIIGGTHQYAEDRYYYPKITLTAPSPNVFAPITVTTTVTVTDPPLTVSPVPFNATEGAPFHGVVATFTSPDPDASISDYHARINWDDGTVSNASDIVLQNGVYQVIGDHTYTEVIPDGLATITVSDQDGGSDSGSVQISVDDAPVKVQPVYFSATEGVPFHGVVATLTDFNPFASKGDYTATIDWGDNTVTQATDIVPVAQHPLVFNVIGDHTYAEELPDPFATITVTDDGGSQDSGTVAIGVDDAPLKADPVAVQFFEGHAYSGLVASFRDYDTYATPADFTATIQWGDGSTTSGTLGYDTTLGKFDVSGSHDYGDHEEGSIPMSVLITDVDGGETATASGQAQVVDAPLTAARVAFNPVEGQRFQGVVASFTDADPYGQLGDYSAKVSANAGINWGDGHISDGTISTNGNGVYYVSGSHTYADEGTYRVKVTVVDAGGASATVDDGFEPLATTGGLSKPLALAAGDFNRDGKTDLLVAQQVSPLGIHNTVNRVTILLGNGDGTFLNGWSTDLPGKGLVAVAAADLNGDGNLDLVVSEEGIYNPDSGGFSGGGVMVFLGNGDGTFRAGPTYADLMGPVAVALGDVNGDGRPDLAIADAGSYGFPSHHTFAGAIRVLTGNGDGTFRSWVTLADHAAPIALAVGDVNGDHRADLVVADAGTYNTNGKLRVLLNQGGGTFHAGWSISTGPITGKAGPGHVALALADFNRDGKLDLAVAKQGAGSLTVYAGKGDGTFRPFVTRTNIASPSALAVADFNGDGKPDLAVADFQPGAVTVWANTLTSVADAPLTGTGVNVTAKAGRLFSGLVATFTDANPAAPVGDFTGTIDWGDGVVTAADITAANGRFNVRGKHKYTHKGSFTLVIHVLDIGGSWVTITSQAQVN